MSCCRGIREHKTSLCGPNFQNLAKVWCHPDKLAYSEKEVAFDDFRRFIKSLKGRPELIDFTISLEQQMEGLFDLGVFKKFMHQKQQVWCFFIVYFKL